MIVFNDGNAYNLAHEHKNGWNAEAFKERYSEVLDRYDYIVGDWGYSQLRLRGFYEDGHPRATKETTITSLSDYLNEYCNFGCAFFVLTKTDAKSLPPDAIVVPQPEAEPDTAAPGAAGEQDAQTAETAASAAASNGILMRWPLKERPGGPVRVPGAAAMARAAQEAERRQQAAAGAKQSDSKPSGGRHGIDGGGSYGGRQGSRPSSDGGSDKRPSGGPNAGQGDGRSGGRQGQSGRGPRPQGSERQGGESSAKTGVQWRPPSESGRGSDGAGETQPGSEAGGQRADSAKSGSRWPGKNRRRNRFGGKPNRPDGAPHGGGAPGNPGGGSSD